MKTSVFFFFGPTFRVCYWVSHLFFSLDPSFASFKTCMLHHLSFCVYSTVTDFAKFLGKSTLRPSRTASQYAMSWRGITFRIPWRTSTVLGISILSAWLLLNSSSSELQITIGLPPRAITKNAYTVSRDIPCRRIRINDEKTNLVGKRSSSS